MDTGRIPLELTAVLGSGKDLEVYFVGNLDQPESLAGATKASLVVRDGPGAAVDMLTRRTDLLNLTLDVPNSRMIAATFTAAELKTTAVLTAISASARKLTLTGDQTAIAGLQPGETVTIPEAGLTNPENAASYTVQSIALNGLNTDVIVVEDLIEDETAVTVNVTFRPQVSPGTYIGYAAVFIGTKWFHTDEFRVNFRAAKAPTF